jgi:hypothetical protein
MKKNCLFLFMVICAGIFFTSCGGDDKNPANSATWKNALGTYNAEGTLKLISINDNNVVGELKSVTLAAGTGENAKVTLTNIVPDNATVEIDNVKMTKDGDNGYTFVGEATVGETIVTVAGGLTGVSDNSKSLTLNVTRKITSPLAGTWKLGFTQAGANIVVNIKPANETIDGLSPLLSSLLAQEVTDVTVVLGEDGTFDVNWTETGKSEPVGMPDFVKQLVTIQYFISDGKLYLSLDKSLVPLLAALPIPEGIDLNAIISALTEDKGGFIALPIGITSGNNTVTFYIGKEAGAILQMLTPVLTGDLPAELSGIVSQIIESLSSAMAESEIFTIGLGFVK